MGRPERPLDPAAGPVQRFAHELRTLREKAGGPSYRLMASRTEFSVAALARAAAGERLPSLAVTRAYVLGCGEDPAEWEPRWTSAEREAAEQEAAATEPYGGGEPSPYRGLVRFEPDDQELFFGRDRLIDELLDLVQGHRFGAVCGASGSGKSSLLRAGLVPRLRRSIAERGGPAVLRVLTPGPTPAATYGRLLAPQDGEPDSWVLVDQFEEIFTLCRDRAERTRFVDLLMAAREDPDSRLRVVVAMRADFYGRCAEHRALAEAMRGAHLLVGPMTPDELRDVIVKPATATGLLVERRLTARIVEEVADQPGALPMLSHALLETWRRRRGRTLTTAAYDAVGGVHGAIATTAEQVHGQLSSDQARTARQVLLRLVEPGHGSQDTRRPISRTELQEWPDPLVPAVVDRLARARLLTVDADGVQLAHEALITRWPRLQGWIEEDRERLRHHRRLTDAARLWLESDRDGGALYRGARLGRAEELFAGSERAGELTLTEQAFLTAGLEAREAELRAAARTTRRARLLVTGLSAVVVVALVAGLFAWQQHGDNQRRGTDDAARRVASVADSLRTTDPRTAQLLGVAAWRISPLPEARRALVGALVQPETDAFDDPAPGEDPQRYLVGSGRRLLSVNGGLWRIWDVTTHRRVASGRLPAGTQRVVAADPDARVLALLRPDQGVRLWDTSTRRWTGAADPVSAIGGLGFTADARSYLVGDDSRVQMRSVADGKELFAAVAPSVAALGASADGRLAAVCPNGSAPQVWETSGRREVAGAWQKAAGICDDVDLRLEDDSAQLVWGGQGAHRLAALTSTGVRVWDTASGRQVASVDDPLPRYAAFSADGDFLAVSGADEIRVWRLSSPTAPVFRHALNGQYLHGGLVWDPARPTLRYLEGGTVHSLDLAAAVTSAWLGHPLDDALLSPDGGTLATVEHTGGYYRFRLLDTRNGHVLRELPSPPRLTGPAGHEALMEHYALPLMTFSPDGAAFAYSVAAPGRQVPVQRFTVWDLTHDRERTSLDLAIPSSGDAVIAVALGPGGHTLYATRLPAYGAMRVEVWGTARHRRTGVLTDLHTTRLAVRPDGRLLAGDNVVAALPEGTVTERSLVRGEQLGALAFSPDGSRLAAGDQTGRVALWDTAVSHSPGVLPSVFPAPLGDTREAVTALALSPDGRTLAVGGGNGTLQLWDTTTQQPLGGPLTTPGEEIRTLAFGPDSTTLHAGSAHVPLQRYRLAPADVLTQVCGRAAATLTPAQWRAYIPDAPYRRVCAATPTG